MPKNHDESALLVLRLAEQKASQVLRKEEIGTECLLMALSEGQDVTGEVLRTSGLTPERVQHGFLRLFGEGKFVHSAKRPFSKAAGENLRRAEALAQNHGDRQISTVHLAIALFRNDEGPVGKLLEFLDIAKDDVVDDLRQLKPFAKANNADVEQLETAFRGS